MKKIILISTLITTIFALTACDNASQKRREECTQAQNTATDRLAGKVDAKTADAAQKKWDELQCHQSDVITH